MQVGDLVIHNGKQIGVVTHLWDNDTADVFFEGGEYQVQRKHLEVVSHASR